MQGQPTALTEITETSGGRVARVTVNRPEKLNALDRPALAALHDAFAGLAADPDLRVAVLTGAGARAFIGGADIAMLNGLDPAGARSMIEAVHGVCQAIRDLPVPVIARVNGWCLGAGLEIAAACDLRLASEGAMFGMPEVRVGLPSVVEAALLPRLVGWGKARELVYLGRNYDAKEAEAMGLVERVTTQSGLDTAVQEWVRDILADGPRAVRLQKALVAEWERLALDQAIRAGVDAIAAAYETDEPARMTAPFLKRKGG